MEPFANTGNSIYEHIEKFVQSQSFLVSSQRELAGVENV